MSGKRVLCSVFSLPNVSRVSLRGMHSANRSDSVPVAKYESSPSRTLSTTNSDYCGKFTHPDVVTQDQADDLIRRLQKHEINLLKTAIQSYESHADNGEGQPSMTSLLGGQVPLATQPTPLTDNGSSSTHGNDGPHHHLAEDWWQKQFAATTPKPTSGQLFKLSVVNGLPFIGFGFLDNFIMILCGDWIEQKLNGYMCLSTMAAAGLGNTISDVFGIQTASYVERFTEYLGFRAPPLTQYQFQMKSSRRAANLGRILGITIGCLIGMTPLLFIDTDKDKKKKEKDGEQKEDAKKSVVPVIVN